MGQLQSRAFCVHIAVCCLSQLDQRFLQKPVARLEASGRVDHPILWGWRDRDCVPGNSTIGLVPRQQDPLVLMTNWGSYSCICVYFLCLLETLCFLSNV